MCFPLFLSSSYSISHTHTHAHAHIHTPSLPPSLYLLLHVLLSIDVPDRILGDNVTVTVINFFEVLLNWPIPGDNNNPITGYIIHYQKMDGLNNTLIMGTLVNNAILEVEPGEQYLVRVAATNDVGANTDDSQDTRKFFFSISSGQSPTLDWSSLLCMCVFV